MPRMPAQVTREERSPPRFPPRATLEIGANAVAFVLAASFSLGACGPTKRAGTPPRNLILVTVDTLRADRMSAFGHARATSDLAGVGEVLGTVPAARKSLDELAAEGVVFARALAPRGMTFPSIATLFTGLAPLEHGAFENQELLCTEVTTLAETLKDAGFATGAFTTNPLLVPDSGIEQGFERFYSDRSGERDLLAVRAAVEWLAELDLEGGPPIFLWLHLMGPHLPYAPAPLEGVDYARLFTEPAYAGPADGSREFLDAAHSASMPWEAQDLEHVRALYDGEIARIDHVVSLFVEILSGVQSEQPVDVLSRSIFAFVADHGEELGERHGYFGHSKSVFDSVLHVPFFLRHPASLTGRRVFGELVELQDFVPTVLDWLDVSAAPVVRGRSLLPLVDGAEFASRDAFATWGRDIFTVRTQAWRLVWNPSGVEPDDPPPGPFPIPEIGLYDVVRDPLERHDVASEHADVVRDLLARIEAWRHGLAPACAGGGAVPPERLEALNELGYAGGVPDAGEGSE